MSTQINDLYYKKKYLKYKRKYNFLKTYASNNITNIKELTGGNPTTPLKNSKNFKFINETDTVHYRRIVNSTNANAQCLLYKNKYYSDIIKPESIVVGTRKDEKIVYGSTDDNTIVGGSIVTYSLFYLSNNELLCIKNVNLETLEDKDYRSYQPYFNISMNNLTNLDVITTRLVGNTRLGIHNYIVKNNDFINWEFEVVFDSYAYDDKNLPRYCFKQIKPKQSYLGTCYIFSYHSVDNIIIIITKEPVDRSLYKYSIHIFSSQNFPTKFRNYK